METEMAADRILRIIQEFQVWDDAMSARTMEIFMIIAKKPGLRMKEIEEKSGLGSSALSRHIKILSRTSWTTTSGPRMAKRERRPTRDAISSLLWKTSRTAATSG